MVIYSISVYDRPTCLSPRKVSYEKDDIDFHDDEEQNVLDYSSYQECEE